MAPCLTISGPKSLGFGSEGVLKIFSLRMTKLVNPDGADSVKILLPISSPLPGYSVEIVSAKRR